MTDELRLKYELELVVAARDKAADVLCWVLPMAEFLAKEAEHAWKHAAEVPDDEYLFATNKALLLQRDAEAAKVSISWITKLVRESDHLVSTLRHRYEEETRR